MASIENLTDGGKLVDLSPRDIFAIAGVRPEEWDIGYARELLSSHDNVYGVRVHLTPKAKPTA